MTTKKIEPVDLEAMADEMALLRKDMNDFIKDLVRQVRDGDYRMSDYVAYDLTHRLQTLERHLRA